MKVRVIMKGFCHNMRCENFNKGLLPQPCMEKDEDQIVYCHSCCEPMFTVPALPKEKLYFTSAAQEVREEGTL